MYDSKNIRDNNALNLLLVEGKDDEHVLYNLFAHYKVPQKFKIKNTEGIDRLIEALDVEVDGSELKRIGVVVDADVVLEDRWKALKKVLLKAGYSSYPLDA